MMHPTGEPRQHYARVIDVARNLTLEQIAEFRGKAKERANGERNLHPVPRVLTAEEAEYLNLAVNQGARALRSLFEDLRSGRQEAVHRRILPPEVLQSVMNKAKTSQEKIQEVPWEQAGFYYGPDIVRHSDGKFYVLEDNSNPGGMADMVESRKDLLDLITLHRSS